MDIPTIRVVAWVGSAKEELMTFPDDVQDVMGFALYRAQIGQRHANAKPLKGFGGAGVLEIVDDFDGDTYRCVYTVRLHAAVYVLHAFQKKSTRGSATPKREIELVRARLAQAERMDAQRIAALKKEARGERT